MTTTAARIPREKENDHTAALGERRREFLHEQTGVELEHVGSFSFDPGDAAGQHRELHRRGAGPDRRSPARCCINGEHAQGDFYVPLATTEGTLVASYNRGMRLLSECGGVKTTVVDDQHAAGAGVHLRRRAAGARVRRHGSTEHFDEIRAAAEATTRSGKLHDIGQYPVGPLRYLRFNYTTGDAAGQNMTGKATLAACEWIKEQLSGRRRATSCRANIDTDKKHSQINMLLTRGKRVVAEAVITQRRARSA